jgi:hypothetical protein
MSVVSGPALKPVSCASASNAGNRWIESIIRMPAINRKEAVEYIIEFLQCFTADISKVMSRSFLLPAASIASTCLMVAPIRAITWERIAGSIVWVVEG